VVFPSFSFNKAAVWKLLAVLID